MRFLHSSTLLFTTQINENNAAFLDGATEVNIEAANSISTVPLNISLWHRHFAHHDHNSVKHMILKELVTGFKIKSNEVPDPICEPCLSGKMNANPFPSSTTHSCKPLELIHTNLHGLFKTCTIGGFCYWVTFIDNCTCFHCLIFLKSKSETFTAFKQYKAYAENHLNAKIKCLRNDKGGEYISNEFKEFLVDHGITSQYTVHARPQQNGVANKQTKQSKSMSLPCLKNLISHHCF